MNLKDSVLHKRLATFAARDSAVNRLLVCVDDCFEDAVNRTKSVVKSMPEYTLHDEVHLLRVVEMMGRVIPDRTLKRLGPLELAALILSAGYHDIGMAPSAAEVRTLLSATNASTGDDERRYLTIREEYPSLLNRQRRLRKARKTFEAAEIETWFLVEHLRRTHAQRARQLLLRDYAEKMIYDNYSFAERLANVCFSHNEDTSSLSAIPAHELVRARGEYCNWRFVAIVLRLADILDFDPKRTPPILFEHLGIRDSVSVREWKKHLAITGWDIKPGRIAFAAQCGDPVIEKCIRDFIRMIDYELAGAHSVLAEMHDPTEPNLASQYMLDLPFKVDTKDIRAAFGADGPLYIYEDLGFSLDQDRIMDLLMGLNLYQTSALFIRELLQNAVDACRHRAALHERRPELGSYNPQVDVRLRRVANEWYLEIEDNGMGMDEHIVRTFFARVGRSYYRSADFLQERAQDSLAFNPVSQFGIGILSVFMAGDHLTVDTRRFSDHATPLSIEVANQGSLFWFNKGKRRVPGTSVRVRLVVNPSSLWNHSYGVEGTLHSTVAQLAPHTKIPITVFQSRLRPAPITETWSVKSIAKRHCEAIDVNLDSTNTGGIEGRLRVYVLQGFVERLTIEGDEDDIEEFDDELSNYMTHQWSYIETVYVDRSVKTRQIEESFSFTVNSEGRWSQHGFSVEHSLFGRNTTPPYISFPFPVRYDLNVLPPLALPLTADRNAIVLTDEARRICDHLTEIISLAFFQTLGTALVRANESFFRTIVAKGKDETGAFLAALNRFIGTQKKGTKRKSN